jgi:hypothetical protein
MLAGAGMHGGAGTRGGAPSSAAMKRTPPSLTGSGDADSGVPMTITLNEHIKHTCVEWSYRAFLMTCCRAPSSLAVLMGPGSHPSPCQSTSRPCHRCGHGVRRVVIEVVT